VAHTLRETGGKIANAPIKATAAQTAPAPTAAADPGEAGLIGDTSQFSLISVLLAIEHDQLTGRLRIQAGPKPVELHVANGQPLLVTVRDATTYMRGSGHKLTTEQTQMASRIGREQDETGAPIFMQFAMHGLMPAVEAADLCELQSYRLFAPLWTAPRARFRFEPSAPLPPHTQGLSTYGGTMSEWAMESLRYLGDEYRTAMAWGLPTGIPAYTRKGYERIQQIPLSDEELAFAGLISPTNNLEKIAAGMRTDVDAAQRVLHRFLCLEIFDYWPANLLQAA
jgi:hypothetical protein